MERLYGYYEWDESVGSPGQREEGGLSQNLYGEEGVLTGHARFVPVDEPLEEYDDYSYENTFVTSDRRREAEGDGLLEGIVAGVVVGIGVFAASKAAPYVFRWWNERARPAIGRMVQKLLQLGRNQRNEVESIEAGEAVSLEVSTNPVQVMSAQEAAARMIAGAAATAYANEQFQRVQSARILGVEDDGQLEDLVKEIPEDERKDLCLEMAKNPELLGDASLANIASMFPSRNQRLEISSEPHKREEREA